ncbi:MAG: CopG family ribbon-helix-helix protein [Polaromonas sp.]
MSTTTLRLDAPLKLRLAHLAQATGRTPHSLMLEALEQKADEMEAQLEFARLAADRDQALQDGQAGVDWHDMKTYLRDRVKAGASAK